MKFLRSVVISLGMALLFATVASAETISPQEASRHVGEFVTVEGVVSQVSRSKGGTTFVNFGGRFPNHVFYGVIFRSKIDAFRGIFSLEGRRVRMEGRIQMYKGKPQIVLSSPQQIQVK